MTATVIMFLHEQLAQASPGLMREMLSTFINAMLSGQADTVCGRLRHPHDRADQPPLEFVRPGSSPAGRRNHHNQRRPSTPRW